MSKNDYVFAFREYLKTVKENANTRKTLLYEFERAFRNQHFKNLDEINYIKLNKHIEGLESKKSSNNLKNALRLFSQKFPKFNYEDTLNIIEKENKKKNYKNLKKRTETRLSTVIRKIAKIKDKKLQLGYLTMMYTGLRISEVANLRKKDIKFEDELSIYIRKSKHNKSRLIKKHVIKDKYFEMHLKNHIRLIKDNEKVFYSISKMSKSATEYGFKSHDLRANHSQYIYDLYEYKKEAVRATQEALGHEYKNNSYKKYLGRDINKSGTKFYI